ncbi:hypothetical protein RYZ20_12020 [Thioclava sp. A2]|nr:hypothetical protein [Thioclava sp. A2]MDV7271627.1 hypothetical protein [Thioclava sp. A2]
MQGFKSFAAAQATLAGIEAAHMIRKEGNYWSEGEKADAKAIA